MAERRWREGARELTERALRADGVGEGDDHRGRRVTVNVGESPLGWLRSRGLLSSRQFDAGERLRADWERAGLAPRVTMSWSAAAHVDAAWSGDPAGATLAHLGAKRRFDAAIAAAGPGLADVMWRVVCAGEGIAVAEKGLGWPARAGKLVLGMALDRLADHYGLAASPALAE